MPSANRGRPPGSREKPLREEMRRALYANDQEELKAVVKSVIKEAKGGDMTAAQIVFDRIDGKVPQAIVGDEDHPPVIPGYRWLRDDEESE